MRNGKVNLGVPRRVIDARLEVPVWLEKLRVELDLAFKIDSLLANKERFSRMRQSVKRLARPHAARDIASIVLEGKST